MGRDCLSLRYYSPEPVVDPPQYQKWTLWNSFNPDDPASYPEKDVVYEAFVDQTDVSAASVATFAHDSEPESDSSASSTHGGEPPASIDNMRLLEILDAHAHDTPVDPSRMVVETRPPADGAATPDSPPSPVMESLSPNVSPFRRRADSSPALPSTFFPPAPLERAYPVAYPRPSRSPDLASDPSARAYVSRTHMWAIMSHPQPPRISS